MRKKKKKFDKYGPEDAPKYWQVGSKTYKVPSFAQRIQMVCEHNDDEIPCKESRKLFESLPKKIFYSMVGTNKKHSIRLEHKAKAIFSSTHIAVNNQFFKHFIVIDVDYNINLDNLPIQPTFSVQNMMDDKAHLFFRLVHPVSVRNPKALKFYQYVKERLTNFLGGDPAYTDVIVKSPFQAMFRKRFTDVDYSLQDLFIFVKEKEAELDKEINKDAQSNLSKYSGRVYTNGQYLSYTKVSDVKFHEITEGNRNSSLFDLIRKYAYTLNPKRHDVEYMSYVYGGQINNQLKHPIKDTELNIIVKSITKYVEAGKHLSFADNKNRGVCTRLELIDNSMKKKTRQSVGAVYTNELQKERTEERIKTAIETLVFKDYIEPYKISIPMIAKKMNSPRGNLYNYKEFISIYLAKAENDFTYEKIQAGEEHENWEVKNGELKERVLISKTYESIVQYSVSDYSCYYLKDFPSPPSRENIKKESISCFSYPKKE